jgi:hypothetical protein
MNIETWNKLLEEIQSKIKEMSGSKGEEYVRGQDRFHNFKRASEFRHFTPERCLEAMMSKHVISIYDQLDDLDKGIDHPLELWEQKIFDNILYLCLLYGLLKERYDNVDGVAAVFYSLENILDLSSNEELYDGINIVQSSRESHCIEPNRCSGYFDFNKNVFVTMGYSYDGIYDINYYLDKENINKNWIFFYRKGCSLCYNLIKDFEINNIIFKKYDVNTVDGVRMLDLYGIKNTTELPIIIESQFTKNLI